MRYAVVGPLWGRLEVVDELRVLDLSSGGARVVSNRRFGVGTTSCASLQSANLAIELTVRVRAVDEDGLGTPLSALSLEFVEVPAAAAAELGRLLDECQQEVVAGQ